MFVEIIHHSRSSVRDTLADNGMVGSMVFVCLSFRYFYNV